MKKSRIKYVLFLVVLLIVVLLASAIEETKDLDKVLEYSDGSFLYFSQEESFHSENFEVELKKDAALPNKAKIFYTLDGNNPTSDSIVYEKPIKITVSENIEATVIRAVVLFKGEYSEIYSKTYFHSKNINELNDLLLVSVISDEHGLYDYDEGILAQGRPYDDFFRDNEDADSVPFWRVPANFKLLRGKENERDAYVEMFFGKDEKLISQSIGLTLSGGASSYMYVKSLKIVARKMYDTMNSKFRYDFYNIIEKDYSELPILQKYDKLILRNAAQDRARSFVRWNVCSTLASQSGLPGVVPARPAIVYLNGEYYGMTQMQPSHSSHYIDTAYGLDEEYVEKFESQEAPAQANAGIRTLVLKDLSIESNAKAIEKVMDVDEVLLYYAFEMCINNTDWPNNNYKLWRYAGEKIPDNKYSDGRLRPLLYDLDFAFRETQTDIFTILLDEPEDRVSFLYRMMKNKSFQHQFINIINDLLSTSLRAENIIEQIDFEEAKVDFYKSDPVFGSEVKNDLSHNMKKHIEDMKTFVSNREAEVRDYIYKYFGYADTYTLKVSSSKAASINWSSLSLSSGQDDFVGEYYSQVPVKFSPTIRAGYVFSHWLVNGKIVKEEQLILSEADIKEKEVNIEIVVNKEEQGLTVLINEVSAKGTNDWIELYNPYANEISLKHMYISDDSSSLYKSPLPDIVLEPNSYLIIYCDNYKVLSGYACSFNIKGGETLYITKAGGNIIDSLYVPDMNENNSFGLSKKENKYVFFSSPTPGKPNL